MFTKPKQTDWLGFAEEWRSRTGGDPMTYLVQMLEYAGKLGGALPEYVLLFANPNRDSGRFNEVQTLVAGRNLAYKKPPETESDNPFIHQDRDNFKECVCYAPWSCVTGVWESCRKEVT